MPTVKGKVHKEPERKGGRENPFEPRSHEIIGVRKAAVFGEGCECWRVGGI